MRLSELLDQLTPEEEGGTTSTKSVILPDGVEVFARKDDWDTYKVDGEFGEWTDGIGMLRFLLKQGVLSDPEINATVEEG